MKAEKPRERDYSEKYTNELVRTRKRMIGGVPPLPLVANQGSVHFEFFELCELPTVLSGRSWLCQGLRVL